MTAAAERVLECWDRACALGGFKGAGASIGAQIDAAVEVLSGPEKVAVRALFGEAWRLTAQFGDAVRAAEYLKLAAAMGEQAGRVLGALKAAQAVEDLLAVPLGKDRTAISVVVAVDEALRANGINAEVGRG